MDVRLQWVHGLVTVVMNRFGATDTFRAGASMGPRSGNRGYGNSTVAPSRQHMLQWVHGLVTVVMSEMADGSMRPKKLQWVHGLVTVVMMGTQEKRR